MSGTVIRKQDIRKMSCNDLGAAYFVMSPERRKKCDKFINEHDKKLCIAADKLLRETLSELTGLKENELVFDVEDGGKPYLKNGECFFNISHSGDYVVVAAGKEKRVGIDIERIREVKTRLLTSVCVQKEIEYILGDIVLPGEYLQDEKICERFFRVWTYKEAYLKFTGEGITDDLKKNIYGEKEFFCEVFDGYCLTVIEE